MSNLNELKRLENDLKNNEELRRKLDEAVKRIVDAGQAQNDGEVMVAAAKELGYDISIAALEQSKAEAEALDPEELDNVSGGYDGVGGDCISDYICEFAWHAEIMDEKGHNYFCITAWHCFTAAMHTEAEETKHACWSDFICMFLSKHDY